LERAPPNILDGDDSIGMVVSSPSGASLTQRGQEVELRAGDAAALIHSEPATLNYVGGLHVGLVFPRAALSQRVTNVDGLTMRAVSRRTEALRLLVSYLKLARL
jgi:hypothetical protein